MPPFARAPEMRLAVRSPFLALVLDGDSGLAESLQQGIRRVKVARSLGRASLG
jgi:hypothetical protein